RVGPAGLAASGAAQLAEAWRGERVERMARRVLDADDFRALAATGYLDLAVPTAGGGTWEGIEASIRELTGVLRTLAAGDASPALVAAMHPAVLSFWLVNPDAAQPAWEEQRTAVFAAAHGGTQWGTVTSEPGAGGDILRSRCRAVPAPDGVVA